MMVLGNVCATLPTFYFMRGYGFISQEIWGQGFVYINAISHVDNIGAYSVLLSLYKYITLHKIKVYSLKINSI